VACIPGGADREGRLRVAAEERDLDMDDLQQSIEQLQRMVGGDSHSSDIWDRFFDLTEQDAFMRLSEPVDDPQMRSWIVPLLGRILPDGENRVEFCMTVVRSAGLHHGSITVGAHFGGYLFFEASKIGLLALVQAFNGSTQFVRFQGVDGFMVESDNSAGH
jgi:hypothetical protein